MNQKFQFITDCKIEPEDLLLNNQVLYSKIVKQLDDHYKLRGELSSKWQKFLTDPEFELIKDENSDHSFKIRSKSDRIVLVNLDDEELASNLIILLNLAFREGAKQVINILKVL